MPRRSNKPFRNGRVHVNKSMCATCIFRPGNIMHLDAGRCEEMTAQAIKNQSAIICHDTLTGPQAVCRGFFEKHATAPLQIAERMGIIEWD